MNYLGNSFSLNMLTRAPHTLDVEPIASSVVPRDAVSCVGHTDVAALMSTELGFEVPVNRVQVQLKAGDALYVAQYIGPRLPEGTTVLPEEARIEWLAVYVYLR